MANLSKGASKLAGGAKGAAKAMTGYPGIFHHLAGEHAEVATAMERVSHSSKESDAREEVFAVIRKSLLAHAKGEEKEFYPRLRQFPELECLDADEAREMEDRYEEVEEQEKSRLQVD